MKYFQEVTEWADNIPNHIYYLKDDKSFLVGYIQAGTKKLFKFSNFNVRDFSSDINPYNLISVVVSL